MPKTGTPKTGTTCAAHFRLQANACLHLAGKATEHWVAASLTELAEEYLDRADRAESKGGRQEARSIAAPEPTRFALASS